MGRGDHAHIDMQRPFATDALKCAVLKDPQEPNLGRQRQLATFIEKQRATIGPLEPPLAFGRRPR